MIWGPLGCRSTDKPAMLLRALGSALLEISPVLTMLVVVGCGKTMRPGPSTFKFDGAYSVALDGYITNGVILSPSDGDDDIRDYVHQQLLYTIGQFNGFGGSPDINRLAVQIETKKSISDDLYKVTYKAKLFIAWPKEVRPRPRTYELIVPARGDAAGSRLFYDQYGLDSYTSKRCMANNAHDVAASIFWYWYRPAKSTCPLTDPTKDDPAVVTRFDVELQVSPENTRGKYPEYGKIWEDGRLVVTAIFGKNEAQSTSNADAGIAAYRATYDSLLREFGEPGLSNLNGELPSATKPEVRLVFETVEGPLDIHLLLVSDIKHVDTTFRQKYNERTKISDMVSYNGHSGLGNSIQVLANMGSFVAGQYQIFVINGCDTFSYVHTALKQAHRKTNGGSDRYLDLITNAMPSFFHEIPLTNMAFIKALVGKSLTYERILRKTDQRQRSVVTGEEDNVWPQPFDNPN